MNRTALALALFAAPAAFAQEASSDWQRVHDPARKAVSAVTAFDNGITVAFRCNDGAFNAIIMGLPPAPDSAGDRRALRMRFGEAEPYETMWNIATDRTAAIGDYPAPLARDFREGGTLRVTIPRGAQDGRNLTYAMDLPASGSAIDETLTACGKPLVDPRDDELEAIDAGGVTGGLVWDREPRPSYPATIRYRGGFAVLSCITNPNGSLRDCEVEMEHPHDGGFGRQAVRSAERGARLRTETGVEPVTLRRVSFRVDFRLE